MLLSETMDTNTKEILNDYGYETWTNQAEPEEYKISKEKLDRTHKAIVQKRKDDFSRDIAAYDAMIANKRLKPPGKKQ